MSSTAVRASTGLVVRAENAERIELSTASSAITLLADSSATGGALSVHHTILGAGTGASPHHHTSATEVFFVMRGLVHFLIGSEIVVIGEGDLAVVPPPLTHAFEVAPHSDAELLIAITPGIERFEQWRQIGRVLNGLESPETLADQSAYDTYADESPAWSPGHTDE